MGVIALELQRALDDVSWRLLEELQENARLSYSELGRRVGLTATAVAERIRRLEELEIIVGYRVELNLEKIGLPMMAYIRITSDERMSAQFAGLVRDLPEVHECHRITGGDTYILKVAIASVRHLESLIDRLMPYGQTVTSIILSSPVTRRVIHPTGSS